MLLPPQYAWIGLVLMGSIFVFVADLIGNTINFDNRFLNALTTAIVFMAAFSFFVYFRYGSVMLTDWGFAVMNPTPSP
jgi:Mn2+/Fe2+ NRAMP family transporter